MTVLEMLMNFVEGVHRETGEYPREVHLGPLAFHVVAQWAHGVCAVEDRSDGSTAIVLAQGTRICPGRRSPQATGVDNEAKEK